MSEFHLPVHSLAIIKVSFLLFWLDLQEVAADNVLERDVLENESEELNEDSHRCIMSYNFYRKFSYMAPCRGFL